MGNKAWKGIFKGPGAAAGETLWELFHENSKGTSYRRAPSAAMAAAWRLRTSGALDFESHPQVALPDSLDLELSLTRAVTAPSRSAEMEPKTLALEEVATLLRYAYGEFGGEDAQGGKPVSSVGGLHALELFFHTACVDGLEAGLYHYYPTGHHLRQLRTKAHNHRIVSGLVDKTLAVQASVILFIAAQPERTVALHGDRGYRYVLLEAGAVVQNLNMTARGLGLACVNAGDFYDRTIDRFLGFDGLGLSTVFILGIGRVPGDIQPLPSDDGQEVH